MKSEIKGRPISIIFDGTTHVCEAMVIVLRFIDNEWTIQQRVGRLTLLAKSMRGEEVAQQIVSVISQELGIPSSYVIAAKRCCYANREGSIQLNSGHRLFFTCIRPRW